MHGIVLVDVKRVYHIRHEVIHAESLVGSMEGIGFKPISIISLMNKRNTAGISCPCDATVNV
jgi:hypothetical protein